MNEYIKLCNEMKEAGFDEYPIFILVTMFIDIMFT